MQCRNKRNTEHMGYIPFFSYMWPQVSTNFLLWKNWKNILELYWMPWDVYVEASYIVTCIYFSFHVVYSLLLSPLTIPYILILILSPTVMTMIRTWSPLFDHCYQILIPRIGQKKWIDPIRKISLILILPQCVTHQTGTCDIWQEAFSFLDFS